MFGNGSKHSQFIAGDGSLQIVSLRLILSGKYKVLTDFFFNQLNLPFGEVLKIAGHSRITAVGTGIHIILYRVNVMVSGPKVKVRLHAPKPGTLHNFHIKGVPAYSTVYFLVVEKIFFRLGGLYFGLWPAVLLFKLLLKQVLVYFLHV